MPAGVLLLQPRLLLLRMERLIPAFQAVCLISATYSIKSVNPTPLCTEKLTNTKNVNVYYWPTGTKNETCGAGGAEPPTPAPPPGLSPISPSIYAIFPSISANNGCSQIGSTYSTKTTSYAPGALSTLVSPGVYRQLNVADLECGADPLISPPPFLFQLDPAFGDCIPGASQGVDPATPLATQTGSISGPGKCPDCGKHEKVGVRAPVQTAALA